MRCDFGWNDARHIWVISVSEERVFKVHSSCQWFQFRLLYLSQVKELLSQLFFLIWIASFSWKVGNAKLTCQWAAPHWSQMVTFIMSNYTSVNWIPWKNPQKWKGWVMWWTNKQLKHYDSEFREGKRSNTQSEDLKGRRRLGGAWQWLIPVYHFYCMCACVCGIRCFSELSEWPTQQQP